MLSNPRAPMLVADLLARGACDLGNGVAVIDGERRLTYAEVDAVTHAIAAHLLASGVEPADRIALVTPNCPEALATVLAASLIGAVVVPMNLRLRAEDMRFQVDDADVKFAVVHPSVEPLARAAGIMDRPSWLVGEEYATEPDRRRIDAVRPAGDSVLIQLYTSGTTGHPKGCLLTQAGWLNSTAALAYQLALRPSDAVATPLPFFHVAGLDMALATLAAGASVVIPQGSATSQLWDAVTRDGATVLHTMAGYGAVLSGAPSELGTLRGIYGGNRWSSGLDGLDARIEIWTGYGATELCGFAAGHDRASLRTHPNTVGRLLLGYTGRIADADGNALPPGEVGELLVRGPGVTPGYWNLPEATAEALRDGWFHTGDLMERSDDGVLRLVDRLKDMVKPGGENVYCMEVEAVLVLHPAVRDCAVLGVPDRKWGEAVKAVVVPSAPVTVEELDAWCLDRLAAYKRPRWYEFADALPRNALAKILKTELRSAHDEGSSFRLPERSP